MRSKDEILADEGMAHQHKLLEIACDIRDVLAGLYGPEDAADVVDAADESQPDPVIVPSPVTQLVAV